MPIEVSLDKIDVSKNSNISVGKNSSISLDKPNFDVEIHPQKYTVVGDDIYIISRVDNPPDWFLDLLDDSINSSDLADSVDDIRTKFENFDEGVTKEIGYLKDADSATAFDITTLKSVTDGNTAGIQHLDITKTTADEARAVSETTIAAWQNSASGGGAWFNDKVSVVSNVAYSAARSASTLSASIAAQQSQILNAMTDIATLEKQVDGKIETWFSVESPVDSNGNILDTVAPYSAWIANNEEVIHTGDTYVYYEEDVNENKTILATYRFVKDPETDEFSWSLFSDDLATEAFSRAINAQTTADSKIVTWYQTYPPSFSTQEERDNGNGDIWVDSDDDNKMYRFDGVEWVEIQSTLIQASVDRLDEATVDVNGQARAKSSLVVNANGVVSGFVAESDGSTSKFTISANEFYVSTNSGSVVRTPFSIVGNDIKFNGSVSFSDLENVPDIVNTPEEVVTAINSANTTEINGGRIDTEQLVIGNADSTEGMYLDKDVIKIINSGIVRVQIGNLNV